MFTTARGAHTRGRPSSLGPRSPRISPSRSSSQRDEERNRERTRKQKGERERERETAGREHKKHGFSGRYGILSAGPRRMFGPVRSIGRPYRFPPSFSFRFFSPGPPIFFFFLYLYSPSRFDLTPYVGRTSKRDNELPD